MAQKKDFTIATGLVVNAPDGGKGNITGGTGKFTTSLSTQSLSAASFNPTDIDLSGKLTAADSISSVSISADNFYGNVKDVTYSELSITGGLSSDGINFTDVTGLVGLGTLDAVSVTITSAASAAIFTIPTSQYRSGKIVIQAVSVGVGTEPPASMETSEILFIQGWDGYNTIVDWCEYATVGIGSTSIVTYKGVIEGDNVEFRATNNHSQTINFVSSISQLYTITTALT